MASNYTVNSDWVDITQYPTLEDHGNDNHTVTIGDLHGNALKFFYFLLKEQRIQCDQKDFDQFVTLYQQFSEEHLKTFELQEIEKNIKKLSPLLKKIQCSWEDFDQLLERIQCNQERFDQLLERIQYNQERFDQLLERIQYNQERFDQLLEKIQCSRGGLLERIQCNQKSIEYWKEDLDQFVTTYQKLLKEHLKAFEREKIKKNTKKFEPLLEELATNRKIKQNIKNLNKRLKHITNRKIQQNIKNLEKLLKHVTKGNQANQPVRLMGDETNDRGHNDYLTLLLFELCERLNIKFTIPLSNHGLDYFLQLARCPKDKDAQTNLSPRESLIGLNLLKEEKQISQNIVNASERYAKKLKLIDYEIDNENKTITIFTHAPVGLEIIEELANRFQIEYKQETPEDLARTIDQINLHFQQARDFAFFDYSEEDIRTLQTFVTDKEAVFPELQKKIKPLDPQTKDYKTHSGLTEADLDELNRLLKTYGDNKRYQCQSLEQKLRTSFIDNFCGLSAQEHSKYYFKCEIGISGRETVPKELPIIRLTWNRECLGNTGFNGGKQFIQSELTHLKEEEYEQQLTSQRPEKIGDYSLTMVHGHEGEDKQYRLFTLNRDNLDKGEALNQIQQDQHTAQEIEQSHALMLLRQRKKIVDTNQYEGSANDYAVAYYDHSSQKIQIYDMPKEKRSTLIQAIWKIEDPCLALHHFKKDQVQQLKTWIDSNKNSDRNLKTLFQDIGKKDKNYKEIKFTRTQVDQLIRLMKNELAEKLPTHQDIVWMKSCLDHLTNKLIFAPKDASTDCHEYPIGLTKDPYDIFDEVYGQLVNHIKSYGGVIEPKPISEPKEGEVARVINLDTDLGKPFSSKGFNRALYWMTESPNDQTKQEVKAGKKILLIKKGPTMAIGYCDQKNQYSEQLLPEKPTTDDGEKLQTFINELKTNSTNHRIENQLLSGCMTNIESLIKENDPTKLWTMRPNINNYQGKYKTITHPTDRLEYYINIREKEAGPYHSVWARLFTPKNNKKNKISAARQLINYAKSGICALQDFSQQDIETLQALLKHDKNDSTNDANTALFRKIQQIMIPSLSHFTEAQLQTLKAIKQEEWKKQENYDETLYNKIKQACQDSELRANEIDFLKTLCFNTNNFDLYSQFSTEIKNKDYKTISFNPKECKALRNLLLRYKKSTLSEQLSKSKRQHDQAFFNQTHLSALKNGRLGEIAKEYLSDSRPRQKVW